jgi:ABC-type phosphate transport system substrate-binding protein
MHAPSRFLIVAALLSAITLTARAGDVVVVGNPAASALTKDQVSDIFLGKSQAMTPVDQVDSAPIRADFYKRATGRELAQVKALWSRLAFSGKGTPPKELADAAAVKKAVAADPKAVGYIDKSAVDASVKVLYTVE